jgi:hypothetical protein
MSAAKASGADTSNGSASKSRDHNQGNQDRKYTIEQKAAVIRVRRCQPTAFYDILGLEEVKTTVSETEIKKAYRKISLLTHPDKNGHEHADEAFKMVSRAFGVLGDKEKKDKYDRYGGDPDSRGGGQPSQSPFSGFSGRSPAAGGGGGGRSWDDEISPEEMFNRFFGGGGMGGGFGGFGGMLVSDVVYEIETNLYSQAAECSTQDLNLYLTLEAVLEYEYINLEEHVLDEDQEIPTHQPTHQQISAPPLQVSCPFSSYLSYPFYHLYFPAATRPQDHACVLTAQSHRIPCTA